MSPSPAHALDGRPGRRLAPLLLVALITAACSPALDWREVRPQGSAVTALFPCKPVAQARRVQLEGQEVRMALHACSADGQTWGLAFADIGDPALVTAALEALQRAAAANVDAVPTPGQDLKVPGATPNPASTRQHLQGRRPDGQPVMLASAVFAHGTTVHQAIALGPSLAEAGIDTFLGGLRVGR